MYSGIVLYNTENISPYIALEFAEMLFSTLNVSVTNANYIKSLKQTRNGTCDFKPVSISLKGLKNKMNRREVTAFDILNIVNDKYYMSFYYFTKEFGENFDIRILYDSKFDHDDIILESIKNLAHYNYFSYGIKYTKCNDIYDAIDYAGGYDITTQFSYEKCFFRNSRNLLNDNRLLRMIYTINIINHHHLKIQVNNTTLKEWILRNKKHGTLEQWSNKLWLWKVVENELDNINNYLGQLGILIAWQESESEADTSKRQKLP